MAVLLFPISLLALVQGQTDVPMGGAIGSLVFSVGCGVNAWIEYLELMLRSHGLDDVSWYDMPSLTRRAESREQRWLLQWRVAMMAKPVVLVAFLLAFAALFVGPFA